MKEKKFLVYNSSVSDSELNTYINNFFLNHKKMYLFGSYSLIKETSTNNLSDFALYSNNVFISSLYDLRKQDTALYFDILQSVFKELSFLPNIEVSFSETDKFSLTNNILDCLNNAKEIQYKKLLTTTLDLSNFIENNNFPTLLKHKNKISFKRFFSSVEDIDLSSITSIPIIKKSIISFAKDINNLNSSYYADNMYGFKALYKTFIDLNDLHNPKDDFIL